MPELPEVETIRRQLSQILPLQISSVKTSPFISSLIDKKSLSLKKLNNLTVTSIERHGKYLYWVTDAKFFLLSHLGMSGCWLVEEKNSSPNPKHAHTHLQFEGQKVSETSPVYVLSYIDPRRFGHLGLLCKEDLRSCLSKLAKDALSPLFTSTYLSEMVARYPNRHIKTTLLDQKLIAGIGNYLACEALVRAKIHPLRKCSDLKHEEISKLKNAITKTIKLSLENNGLSFDGAYRDTNGHAGEAISKLVVYQQSLCGLCKQGKVEKFFLEGRGTYYCPKCQR